MTIESLRMFFHVPCFKCFVCDMPLGDGSHGADVRVRARKLHCQKCYSSVESEHIYCTKIIGSMSELFSIFRWATL